MLLRTTVGAHAGEIRDYSFTAGQAAINAGLAAPVNGPVSQSDETPRATVERPERAKKHVRKR